MIYIEKILSKFKQCLRKNNFHLRKEYLNIALYSPSYVIDDKLQIMEKGTTIGNQESSDDD